MKEATILSGEIGNYAFYGCDILASTIIGDDVTSIGRGTFQECEKLNKVVFGKSLEKIGQMAFSLCSIIECYCYATIPPILEVTWNNKNPTTFHLGVTQEAKLYVPARCGVTYERSKWRNYFDRIEEMD